MNGPRELLPPTSVIREKLARNIRERQVLRGLLRLATLASEPIEFLGDRGVEGRAEAQDRRAACA